MPEKTASFIQALLIVTSVFTMVAIFVILYVLYFQKKKKELMVKNQQLEKEFQQQLLQSMLEVQEMTFEQIGKELHDNVGQLLGSTRMLLGITERTVQPVPETLLTANDTLGRAIAELRSLSKVLNKEWLEQFNFSDNIKAETARINLSGQTEVLYHEGSEFSGWKPESQIMLFRIVQEAIQNAIRHANARQIMIESRKQDSGVLLTVTDNGNGFVEKESTDKGVGMLNMRQRVALLGGEVQWISGKGSGTTVSISIPFTT